MESKEPEAPAGPDDAPAHYAERSDEETSPQTGDGVLPQASEAAPGDGPDVDPAAAHGADEQS